MFANKTITTIAHELLRRFVREGSTVIDATAGNGGDTLFLSECVAEHGTVYAFDIQQQAILHTEKLLERHHAENVVLIHDGHEHIGAYKIGAISAAVFNLGYLPSGDKTLVTKPDTTIAAVKECLRLLTSGGAVVIVSYYAHAGGLEEQRELDTYLKTADSRFLVSKIEFVNRPNYPPILYTIEKIS